MPFKSVKAKPERFKVLGQLEPDAWKVKAADPSDPVTEDDLTFASRVDALQHELAVMKSDQALLISSRPYASGGMGAVKEGISKHLDELEQLSDTLGAAKMDEQKPLDYEYQEWDFRASGVFWRSGIQQRQFEDLERAGWRVFAAYESYLVLRRKRQPIPPVPKETLSR